MAAVAAVETATELELDEQKTLAKIQHYIYHPPTTSRVFTIRPLIATSLLQNFNEGNRPKKARSIACYANDMAAQLWPLTGDTLKFSDARRLRDGQNRLAACVRAGVPFQTHIVFGIDDAAFDRLDQGRNRNGADVLAIAGYQNTTVLSGAVRWAHMIELGRAKQRDTYQPADILRLLRERFHELPNYVQQGRVIYERGNQPQAVTVALLYLLHRLNPLKAAEFATAWETGDWAGKFKAIGMMQSRLSELRASTSGRIHDVVRAALIIKAWNIYASGRKGTKNEMEWVLSEDFPKIETGA